jgi:FlgD Ig-like domain
MKFILFFTTLLFFLFPLYSEVNITPISHFGQSQTYGFNAIKISESILACKPNTGIDMYSVSQSSDIQLESHTDIPNPLSFKIHDNYVYVYSLSKDHQQKIFSQIEISDITEPEIIQQLSFNAGERTCSFAIFNSNILFMYEKCINESINIHIYSIPGLEYYETIYNMDFFYELNENIGYSLGESPENNPSFWDMTNPFQIEFILEVDMSPYHEIGYGPTEFKVFNDSLLAASGQTGVSFWNISDFENWIYINKLDYPDGYNENMSSPICIDENLMIVSDNYGLSLYDIGNLSNITFLDDVQCEGSNSGLNMTSFQINNGFLYATGYKDGVHIFSYDDSSFSFIEDYFETPNYYQIIINNSLLIACSYDHGIYFYNCEDPEFPELYPEYLSYNNILAFYCNYGKLAVSYLSNGSLYFDLYDVSNPSNINLITTYSLELYEIIVSVNEDWSELFLQNVNYGNQAFRRVHLDQSGSIETIYSYDLPERSFAILDDIGYYLEYINSIPNVIIIDELNSNYPEIIETVEVNSTNQDLIFTLKENLLQFYSLSEQLIFFYDIVNPASLQFLTALSEPTYATDGMVLEDHYFGVNGYMSYVYDVSTPSAIVYPINTEYANYNIYSIKKMIINENNYAVLNNQGSLEIWNLDISTEIKNYEVIKYSSVLSNYPNPFNPSTTISFNLTTELTENTEISIYNLKGQKVKTLVSSNQTAGVHTVTWNGTDNYDQPVSSGIYFYQLEVDGKPIASRKCLMLK